MTKPNNISADQVVIFLDATGVIQSLYPDAGEVLGHDAVSLPGCPLTTLITAEHHDQVQAWLSAPQSQAPIELTGCRNDDAPYPLSLSLALAPNQQLVALLRDLSEQQITRQETLAARTAADQALQDRGRFLAEISHELRTPLNAIIGFADIIATQRFGKDAGDRYLQYAQHILASGEQMRDCIDDLGAGVGLATTDVNVVQPIIVRDLVTEVAGLLRQRAAAKDITIHCQISGDPTIHGEPMSLRQILLNLGSDAIGNTPDQGHIALNVAPDAEGRLCLTVTDSGGGIEAAAIPLLFDPYVRGKAQGSRPGLSVIRTLVEIHGGEFTVDSVEGEGATFRVALPQDSWSSAAPDEGLPKSDPSE